MPQPIPDLSRDQTCHHYQAPTGQRCGSPALKGEYYCYHHLVKQAARANRRFLIDPELTCMDLPPVEDRASIFIALAAVIHRLGENTIDTRRAGQLIYALQVALKALQPAPQSRPTAQSHPPAGTQPATAAEPTAPPSNQASAGPAAIPHPSSSRPNPERAERVEGGVERPPHLPAPATIPITKESLLYFLRSRHCANCNAELFPASALGERPNPGAPPTVIEESRPALAAPQQALTQTPDHTPELGCPIHDSSTAMSEIDHSIPGHPDLDPSATLPTLQAVAEASILHGPASPPDPRLQRTTRNQQPATSLRRLASENMRSMRHRRARPQRRRHHRRLRQLLLSRPRRLRRLAVNLQAIRTLRGQR